MGLVGAGLEGWRRVNVQTVDIWQGFRVINGDPPCTDARHFLDGRARRGCGRAGRYLGWWSLAVGGEGGWWILAILGDPPLRET